MAKTIKLPVLYRSATVDRAAINADKRTVELSFSSELPVERWYGTEILDHSKESVDLSRINTGGPLLVDHDSRDQVGVVESARIEDRKGRAVVRFGNSQRATEIFQDVKDGIRSLVSVGYRINKMVTEKVEKGVETMRATSWEPMEISLVSIPADTTVGVGRGQQIDTFEVIVTDNTNFMPTETAPTTPTAPAPTPGLEAGRTDGITAERARQKEIRAIAARLTGKVEKIAEMAERAIESGMTADNFRQQGMEALPTLAPVQPAKPLDIPVREWSRYSISKVCHTLANPQSMRLDGFEKEVNDEIAMRQGKRAEGAWLPPEAFMFDRAHTIGGARSFVAGTGTLGGMLIETSNLGDQFIELLRNRAKVMMLGARTLNLDNPVTIPRQNAAGATNWVSGTTASTLSVGNFTQITLSPHPITAFQQYDKQLLATGNPSIDSLIRDDITQQIALAIDLAALHGSGSPDPTGIANTTGINTVTLSANGLALGNTTAYPALVSMETGIASSNADVANMAYLMRAGHRGALKTNTRFASTDTPVWDVRANPTPVNGYRSEVTQQIATNLTTGTATTITSAIFFGNWADLIIANFAGGATDLVVDPYVLAVNGVVRLIARRWVDVGVRHPLSFSVLGGILTT